MIKATGRYYPVQFHVISTGSSHLSFPFGVEQEKSLSDYFCIRWLLIAFWDLRQKLPVAVFCCVLINNTVFVVQFHMISIEMFPHRHLFSWDACIWEHVA